MSEPHPGLCLEPYKTAEGEHALCGRMKGHDGEHGLHRIARRCIRFYSDDDYFDRWQENMEREQSAREASSSGGRCW